MAYLNISTRDGLQRVPLLQNRLRIGRLSSNDIILPYQQISREHAELQRGADSWWIFDLDSTNGLQVNGRPITRYPLQPGERVRLGPDITIWLMTDDDELTALATMQMPTPGQPEPGRQATDQARPAQTGVPPVRLHLTLPARDLTDSPSFDPPIERSFQGAEGSQANLSGPWTPPAQATTWSGEIQAGNETERRRRLTTRQHDSSAAAPDGDLFRRSRTRRSERPPTRSTQQAGAGGTINTAPLHLCQTCGQRTAPDAIACQFCHSPISHPCNRCGMSLLPSQERCLRCQSPNPAFVRSTR